MDLKVISQSTLHPTLQEVQSIMSFWVFYNGSLWVYFEAYINNNTIETKIIQYNYCRVRNSVMAQTHCMGLGAGPGQETWLAQ